MKQPRSIAMLQEELAGLVSESVAFREHAFTVFDADDFAAKADGRKLSLPLAGISYDGAIREDNNSGGRPANSISNSVAMITFQFSVIIAVQYDFAGQADTKVEATDLLDDLRYLVMGHMGVGSRRWVYAGEKPEDVPSGDGMIFYSQAWRTRLPVSGKYNNQ